MVEGLHRNLARKGPEVPKSGSGGIFSEEDQPQAERQPAAESGVSTAERNQKLAAELTKYIQSYVQQEGAKWKLEHPVDLKDVEKLVEETPGAVAEMIKAWQAGQVEDLKQHMPEIIKTLNKLKRVYNQETQDGGLFDGELTNADVEKVLTGVDMVLSKIFPQGLVVTAAMRALFKFLESKGVGPAKIVKDVWSYSSAEIGRMGKYMPPIP